MGRLDRFGEPLDETSDADVELHDPRCRNGWLGEDSQGRAIFCPKCKPHLVDKLNRKDHP